MGHERLMAEVRNGNLIHYGMQERHKDEGSEALHRYVLCSQGYVYLHFLKDNS